MIERREIRQDFPDSVACVLKERTRFFVFPDLDPSVNSTPHAFAHKKKSPRSPRANTRYFSSDARALRITAVSIADVLTRA
jgi:hypothetical protein